MDLNKSINLSFDLKGVDLKNAKLPLVISSASLICLLFFGYMALGLYQNFDTHASAKAQYESLLQEKVTLKNKLNSTLKNNVDLIDTITKSPASKSELTAALSVLVTRNGLKISKLTSNDSGGISATKDSAVELEADGSFSSIKNFLNQIKSIVMVSDVISLKIGKSREATSLHLSLAVKYTQPPKLNVKPQNFAFRMGGEDYYYGSFDDWHMYKTGFVQATESFSVNNSNPQQPTTQSSDVKRVDPFQAPPQPNSVISKERGDLNQGDLGNSPAVVKKNNAMYLSGIIFSGNKNFCIVVLASGESKILSEGEKVNGKNTVTRITNETVTFSGKKLNQFKVGQELSL